MVHDLLVKLTTGNAARLPSALPFPSSAPNETSGQVRTMPRLIGLHFVLEVRLRSKSERLQRLDLLCVVLSGDKRHIDRLHGL